MHDASVILETCVETLGKRAAIRDVERERSMEKTVQMFNALTGANIAITDGWLFMVCLKMVRSRQGAFHLDDYVDGASYFALAGECASEFIAVVQDTAV